MLNEITDFLKSVQGLITSATALFAEAVAIVYAWKRPKNLSDSTNPREPNDGINPLSEGNGPKPLTGKKRRGRPAGRKPRTLTIQIRVTLLCAFLFTLGCVAFYFTPESASGARNRAVRAAWRSIDKEHWDAVIPSADKVIQEFAPTAEREERELEAAKTPKPPIGSVPEAERATIFNRGVLNDVATCYFVKGKALERLGRNQEAVRAYDEAAKLTYARTWDPDGNSFFSPAQAAEDRLIVLSRQ